MSNKMVMNGDRTKVPYYLGGEEQQGINVLISVLTRGI